MENLACLSLFAFTDGLTTNVLLAFVAGVVAVLAWNHFRVGEWARNTLQTFQQAAPPRPASQPAPAATRPLSILAAAASWVAQVNGGAIDPAERELRAAEVLKKHLEVLLPEGGPQQKQAAKPRARAKKGVTDGE